MKRTNMYCMVTLTILCTLTASDLALRAGNRSAAMTGPTAENALATEEEITKALRENNADAITSMLDDDWIVISTSGGVGEGKSIFPEGIKSGHLTRKTMELFEPRVRLYGDVALITSKLKTSGMFGGKPFDVTERQTDVLVWKDGAWKSVLTHETKVQ
jgi:ketosteroid isomerase-like protein